jgi:hypothetical protein
MTSPADLDDASPRSSVFFARALGTVHGIWPTLCVEARERMPGLWQAFDVKS